MVTLSKELIEALDILKNSGLTLDLQDPLEDRIETELADGRFNNEVRDRLFGILFILKLGNEYTNITEQLLSGDISQEDFLEEAKRIENNLLNTK